MHYVYILKLSNNDYYAGSTKNLKMRIKKHKNGEVPYTAKFRPIGLVWYSAFESKEKATKFEDYLKTGAGKAFRNKRLIS